MLWLTLIAIFSLPASPILAAPLAHAEVAQIAPDYSTTTLEAFAVSVAQDNHLNVEKFTKTLECESHFMWNAYGDASSSVGAVQIHLPAHPDITEQEALDPYFSISWAAKQFAKGNASAWTCYRLIESGEYPP